MKMIDIQNHLRKVLPSFDDNFNTMYSVDNATVLSGVMTINSPNHGLGINDPIIISNVSYKHEASLIGKITPLRASLKADSDVDFGKRNDDKITLESNEAYYNGDFDLLEYDDNRLGFFIQVNSNAPSSTIEEINIIEYNLCSFNGEREVLSIIDADNFTVKTSGLDGSILEGGSFYNPFKDIRINASVDIEDIMDRVKQGDLKGHNLFITASASNISRDRNLKTDAPQRLEQGNSIQIDTWEEFSVFAIIDSQNSVDPVVDQDYCRNELKASLLSSLLAYQPPSYTSAPNDYIYYDGDSLLTYNTATYIHQYNFGCTMKVNGSDAYEPMSCLVNGVKVDYFKNDDIKAQDTITFNNN